MRLHIEKLVLWFKIEKLVSWIFVSRPVWAENSEKEKTRGLPADAHIIYICFYLPVNGHILSVSARIVSYTIKRKTPFLRRFSRCLIYLFFAVFSALTRTGHSVKKKSVAGTPKVERYSIKAFVFFLLVLYT